MNISILDAHTLNPGDLSWESFEQFGAVNIYPRTSAEEILQHSQNAQVILTNKVPLSKETLSQLPELKYIGVTATGTNGVDIEYARSKNITVTNVPGYSTDSVAQQIFSFILHFSSQAAQHSEKVFQGDWVKSTDFSFTLSTIHEIKGKTLGVIGLGAIGRRTAEIAMAFGMKICAAHQSSMNRLELAYDVEWTTNDEVFQKADFLTLCCPLTEKTQSLVNTERLSLMKKSAIIINTGRGPLIDEQALANALNNNVIAGAGLDVLSSEPPAADNPLLSSANCLITPHIAWASFEARTRLIDITHQNIKAFVNNEKLNCV